MNIEKLTKSKELFKLKTILVLFSIIISSGCIEPNNWITSKNNIVGTWTLESSLGEAHGSTTFIFNNDGTGRTYASLNNVITNNQEFTYQLNNGHITIVTNSKTITSTYNLLNSNTLILDQYIFNRRC